MATIKAIAASSVHQIQSGQVIVDLTSVVKELVENALDAGASSIEVRFKNNGLDSIEVQDNGSGIAPEDFDTLSSYDDLDTLETFGFRGEALSSLCALSDFHVTTTTAGPKGSRLEFEVSGKLRGTTVVAATKGTTVSVEKLFKNLPVRRRELEKNVKREYGKVLNFLQAYACISTNVRFSVSNLLAKGKKTIAFSTKSNPTTKENIVNVYGAKTLLALVAMDLSFEMQPSYHTSAPSAKRDEPKGEDAGSRRVRIQGHISKPIFGEGRQAPDRQMFFVNSRPCQLPQVSKAFNEVYRSFNVSQSPFIFANLIMDTNAYDVNVSPDKRTILLHDQNDLLESLKESLSGLFEQQDQTVPTSQLQAKKLPSFKQPTLLRTETSRGSYTEQDASAEDSPRFADATPEDRSQRQPGELIYGWVGRDAESRAATQSDAVPNGHISANQLKLAQAFARRTLEGQGRVEDSAPGTYAQDERTSDAVPRDEDEMDLGNGSIDPSSLSPPRAVPREVQDFNDRILSHRMKSAKQPSRVTTETMELDGEHLIDRSRSDSAERSESEGIPAIHPITGKAAPGPVQNAFDRMRPKRTQPEVATVTVGDKTMHMTLEGPESKKRRMHTPKLTGKTKGIPASSGFTCGLKMFAAAGSQMADEATQQSVNGGDDQEEAEDGSKEIEKDLEGAGNDDEPSPLTEEDELANGQASTNSTAAREYQSPRAGLFVEADESDDEYLDEDDKKAREDAKIARMIEEAEAKASQPTEETLRKASQVLRSSSRRKDAPLSLQQILSVSLSWLEEGEIADVGSRSSQPHVSTRPGTDDIESDNAEAKLSLTISKPDFAAMRIIGQFNLGFILAIRPASAPDSTSSSEGMDHLFIIDQHAADEKFNFERLTATTNLTAQRLVTPKELQLSAVEEELISANTASLLANGFEIEVTEPEDIDHGTDPDHVMSTSPGRDAHTRRRFQLLTLPTSKETTFSTADLEELLHLLSESAGAAQPPSLPRSTSSSISTPSSINSSGITQPSPLAHQSSLSLQGGTIIRPSRVRKMMAMRACRSSIMVGKNLTRSRMQKVVRHMGEMERPWNCPHGRPTMRHLAGLGEWSSWDEDLDGDIDWVRFVN
ncbi:DNA mismatch repair protein pms1 [Elsinoe australis]|uniref:DNA mismatch repair protein pms1 n=1 Tax=Elsinoe australis TaxID=40998 RepID=A0A2P7YW13_9PEZI|nr:DNA mismatch repair protein pms1 [Elsinoe australis]